MAPILVTGAAGFVGSRVAQRLGARCRGLVRRPLDHAVEWPTVVGDLNTIQDWSPILGGVSTVVHLAARTGKATAEEHTRSNVEATRRLLNACEKNGVEHFLFVSTIAVNFDDLARYPYAASKKQTEQLVRSSGLRTTIVRPTMVLGPQSPILAALEKLATLPVCPVFGDGRTLVQPVHVDDLVATLLALVESPGDGGEAFEIGGAQRVSIEDLLREIRRAKKKSSGPMLHLPLPILLPLLAVGESIALRWMPFTIGQLATFRFDGTATSVPAGRIPAPTHDLASMIVTPGSS